jgi:hypothetical protein
LDSSFSKFLISPQLTYRTFSILVIKFTNFLYKQIRIFEAQLNQSKKKRVLISDVVKPVVCFVELERIKKKGITDDKQWFRTPERKKT